MEPWAQLLSKFSKGLSSKTLRNSKKFFASTPKLSPATLSLTRPKDIQLGTGFATFFHQLSCQGVTQPKRISLKFIYKSHKLLKSLIEFPRKHILKLRFNESIRTFPFPSIKFSQLPQRTFCSSKQLLRDVLRSEFTILTISWGKFVGSRTIAAVQDDLISPYDVNISKVLSLGSMQR